MNARSAFDSNEPRETTGFYDALIRRGPIGQVAFGLFRAQKRSHRAKSYRSGRFKHTAYSAKNEALQYLNAALSLDGSLTWGWGVDEMQPFHRHVLYVETPHGQVSYHSVSNYGGPAYTGTWDGVRDASNERVLRFCDDVLQGLKMETGDWLLMPFGRDVGKPATSLDHGHLRWLSTWPGLESWPTIRGFVHRAVVMPQPFPDASDGAGPVSGSPSDEDGGSGQPRAWDEGFSVPAEGETCPF